MKKIIFLPLSLLLIILLFVGIFNLYNRLSENYENDTLSEATEPPDTDTPLAPDFTVLDWDGKEVSLSSFRGKPVVVNFWASWCPPCKREMPDFQEVYEEYGDSIIFMMVDMTDGARETVNAAKAFIEKEGYTFPVYFDIQGSAAMAFGATSLPSSYFIDADGGAVTHAVGAINKETLLKGIDMIK